MEFIHRYYIAFLILFFIKTSNVSGQELHSLEKEIDQVVNVLLFDKEKYYLEYTLFFDCERINTIFNKNDFLLQTDLKGVPIKILDELEADAIFKNSQKKFEIKNKWPENFLSDILRKFNRFLWTNRLGSENCVTSSQYRKIFYNDGLKHQFLKDTNTIKNPNLIMLSNPIFDLKKEHCIITLVDSYFPGSFVSRDFFLKKIYGKWVVLATFNEIIS